MEQGKLNPSESPLVDFDAVCQKVRAAIEPARAHALSLHDESGDVLWLSESSMGPDEHNAVREALEEFAKPNGQAMLAQDLGDARSALLLRAVNSQRAMVGAVMVIMDTRGIKQDEHGAITMMTPKLQRALSEFAGMRALPPPLSPGRTSAKPNAPAPASAAGPKAASAAKPPGATPTLTRPASSTPASLASAASAPSTRAPPPAPATPPRAPATLPHAAATKTAASTNSATPGGMAEPSVAPGTMPSLEFSMTDAASGAAPPSTGAAPNPSATSTPKKSSKAPPVTPEIDRLHAALRRSPISLHVQRLVPLTKGSQLQRYEVLLRSKSEDAPNSAPQAMLKAAVENGLGSMIDRRVVTELIGWLVHHPDVWQDNTVMFSVNLTTTALHDEHFMKFVELCLAKSSLPKGTIAFEVDVPTAVKLKEKVGTVAAALHRLACPLVLDDFALRTECFELLRMPGVRYVKLAADITAKMRTDKISQAAITAVVQMSRVLGMHTVAKRTESTAEQEWLTALGVDFIQSNSISPPIAIESLGRAVATKA